MRYLDFLAVMDDISLVDSIPDYIHTHPRNYLGTKRNFYHFFCHNSNFDLAAYLKNCPSMKQVCGPSLSRFA